MFEQVVMPSLLSKMKETDRGFGGKVRRKFIHPKWMKSFYKCLCRNNKVGIMQNACVFDQFPASCDFDAVKMFETAKDEIYIVMGETVYRDELDNISLDSFDSVFLVPNNEQKVFQKQSELNSNMRYESSYEELFVDDVDEYDLSPTVKAVVDQTVWKYTGLLF